MQTLYAVDVEAVSGSADDFAAIRDAVIDWAFNTTNRPGSILDGSGALDVDGKRLSWEVLEVAGTTTRLWTIEVCTPLQGTVDSEFVCAVTVSESDGRVALHVDLGRRSSSAVVAPAPLDFLDRPRIVPTVLSSVPCHYGPHEPVSATALTARASDMEPIVALLDSSERRLPVLVVSSIDAGSPEARFARGVADRLAGLAHVVLLETWLALDALNARHALTVPNRGARLFWPAAAGARRHPWWTADQLRDPRTVSNQLFTMLSRLSVVANARDRLAESVRRAEREAARRAGQERIEAAVSVGDLQRAMAELTSQLSDERRQVLNLLELNEQLEEENGELKRYKENFEALVAYQDAAESAEPPAEAVDISPDFRELWPALESESSGALVFTDRAKASWIDSPYPYTVRMRDALERLARAAAGWRERRGELGMSLTSWITVEAALQYAADDEGMRRARLDTFEFDGQTYSRLPHIKLDDNVPPDRVGRIYFGIDKDGQRWIVDHVGVKIFSH